MTGSPDAKGSHPAAPAHPGRDITESDLLKRTQLSQLTLPRSRPPRSLACHGPTEESFTEFLEI